MGKEGIGFSTGVNERQYREKEVPYRLIDINRTNRRTNVRHKRVILFSKYLYRQST